MPSRPTISELLAHKTVFLTGATGFLGKALIEKLLRSVPSIHKIYALIRPRYKQPADNRLHHDILNSRLFDRLRQEYVDFETFFVSKVSAVAGDITFPMLGLNANDLLVLRNSVQLTIHAAASVKLNAPLDTAARVNCLGALHVLAFAESCAQIQCFVHVSTAFVNANRRDGDKMIVHEQLYPLAFNLEKAFTKIASATTPREVEAIHNRIIGAYPNTYTLTKAMAEHLVVQRATMPLVILRPTATGATWREPVPGFMDQHAAVSSMLLAIGVGVLTAMVGDQHHLIDMVPLDLVVHTTLAALAFSLDEPRCSTGSNKPFIVHAGTSDPRENPVDYARPSRAALAYFRACPPQKAFFKPTLQTYTSPWRFRVAWVCQYELRLFALSTVATLTQSRRLQQKSQDLQKLTRRAETIVEAFRPFTTHQWVFQVDSLARLRARFGGEGDDNEWWLTSQEIDWDMWTTQLCMGLKKYVLQETGIEMEAPRRVRAMSSAWTKRVLEELEKM